MNLDAHQLEVLRHMGVPVYLLRTRGAPDAAPSFETAETTLRTKPLSVVKPLAQAVFKADPPADGSAALVASPVITVLGPELHLPAAHLQRFSASRLFQHLCLALRCPLANVAIVENPVLSDTALHFHLPGKAPLKLGALALLNSNWRARRSAWQAIRGWRD